LLYFDFILKEEAYKESKGTAIKNIPPFDILKNFYIPLPPLGEQQRILDEVDNWMSLVDSIDRNKEHLESIIKQTKSKILDLAIHGKLVPQDLNDEPASELIKRINPKAEITCDNGQYGKVPVNWCITCIKNAFLINPRNKAEDVNNAGFVPMTNICDGYFNRFTYETKKWAEIKTGFTHFADGDIAVAKISPCLENRKSMVLKNLPNGIGAGTTELHVFRPLCVIQSFGLWFFKSDYFVNQCVGTFNGVVGQQRVGKNIVEDILFPLPPLAEQHRIVAKIEELSSSLDNIQKALEV
jgi:type I restriction enzyme S subunit